MIKLNIQNGRLIIDPSTLSIAAFNDIYESVPGKDKTKSSNMIMYVFHICDITDLNPFRDLPESQRDSMAKRNAFGKQDYKFNPTEQKLIDRAIAWYNVLNKNSVMRLGFAIDNKLDEISEFLNDPKNKITTSTQFDDQSDAIAKVDKLLKSKKATEEYIRTETDKVKVRGGGTLSPNAQGLLD